MKEVNYSPVQEMDSVPSFRVPFSKSVANRWLVLKALFPKLEADYPSEADDYRILQRALQSDDEVIDLGAAGTAMRFCTAFFAVQRNRVVELRGSERMHKRPIGPLVDALRTLGASIHYLEEEGYPPLRIEGKKLRGGQVWLPADISSQFITALMLVAPATHDGLQIHRTSRQVSHPYIRMTAHVLRESGVEVEIEGELIHVHGEPTSGASLKGEGDWSAAVAPLAWTAVTGNPVDVLGLKPDSVQGDKVLQDFAAELGVEATWEGERWCLRKGTVPAESLELDLLDFPDLAQSLILAGLGQKRSGKMSGLRTLRIKETDRLKALEESIEALGGDCTTSGGSIYWSVDELKHPDGTLKTYDDHRMAMALAPLSYHFPIRMDHPEVVSKSFPAFWKEASHMGIQLVEPPM